MYTSPILVIATFIFIGYSPCISAECTEETVSDKCNFFASNDCPLYQKSIMCMQKEMAECDEKEKKVILERVKYYESEKDYCPGLSDGQCYFSVTNDCLRNMPYFYTATKEKCQKLSETSKIAHNCLVGLRSTCNTEKGLEYIQGNINYVADKKKKCQDFQ